MTERPRIEEQLRRLRRTVRGLAAAAVGLPLLAVGLAMGSAGRTVVQAERFELVNPDGRVPAVLGVGEEGAGLTLLDGGGRRRATLTHGEQQTALFLLDDTLTVRVGAAQFAHGGGGFALDGAGSEGASVLYHKGGGALNFFSDAGDVLHRVAPPATEETP